MTCHWSPRPPYLPGRRREEEEQERVDPFVYCSCDLLTGSPLSSVDRAFSPFRLSRFVGILGVYGAEIDEDGGWRS
ncbi:unnamed protein product [Victoria cruziana]